MKRKTLATIITFVLGFAASSAFGQLDIQIQQVDANNFPFIFVTAGVTNNGNPVGDLTGSNFSATEDGRPQTNYFDVTPPDNSGGVRLVDFVFLIDNSGSMGAEIAAVRNNVNNFANQMAASGIDYRLGAVRFGQSTNSGQPFIYNNGNLTGDLNTFHSWINNMSANGGIEPGLLAVQMAASTFNFRAGSQRHFLLITDEQSNGGGSLGGAISACNSNNVIVHVAVDCGYAYPQAYSHYCAPTTSISGATGGMVFSVMGPYSNILNAIGQAISNTYVIRYRTDNPNYDGQERIVRIDVNAFGQNDYAIGHYIPGAGPQIVRTAETINLSNVSQVAGSPLTIAANITDQVSPYVSSARVYYRIAGQGSYSYVNMTHLGTLYSGQIPGGSVITPGVQYYITATDGQLTSTDPSVEPDVNPYNIAVLPNVAPAISHTPIATAGTCNDIIITASVVDNTHNTSAVVLSYKKTGTLVYSSQNMTIQGGNTYSGTIPSVIVTTDGVDYYIRATDDLGVFSDHGPHHINISNMFAFVTEKRQLANDILNIQRPISYFDYHRPPLFESSEHQALNFANSIYQQGNSADQLDIQGVARLALTERITKQASTDAVQLSEYGARGLVSISTTIILGAIVRHFSDIVRHVPWIGKWAADQLDNAAEFLTRGLRSQLLIFNNNFKSGQLTIPQWLAANQQAQQLLATAEVNTIKKANDHFLTNETNLGFFDKVENIFREAPYLMGYEAISKGRQQEAVSKAISHSFDPTTFQTANADATNRLQNMTASDQQKLDASNFIDIVRNYASWIALAASIIGIVLGFLSGGIISAIAGVAAIVATIASLTSMGAAITEAAGTGIYVIGVMPAGYLNPSIDDAFGSQNIVQGVQNTNGSQSDAIVRFASDQSNGSIPSIMGLNDHFQQVHRYYLDFRQQILDRNPNWTTLGFDSLSYYQALASQDEESAIAEFFAASDSAEQVLPTFRTNINLFLSLSVSEYFYCAALNLYSVPARLGSADSNYVSKMIETLDSCVAKYSLLTALGAAIHDSITTYAIPIPTAVGVGDVKWSLVNPQQKIVRLETNLINFGNTSATDVIGQAIVDSELATIVGDSQHVVTLGPGASESITYDLQLADSTCGGLICALRSSQSNEYYTMPGRNFTVDLHGFEYEVDCQFTPRPWNINWIKKPRSTVNAIIQNFPQGYSPRDIVPGSIRLNGTVPIDGRLKIDEMDGMKAIASFVRRDAILTLGNLPRPGEYKGIVTGEFLDGIHFVSEGEITLVP